MPTKSQLIRAKQAEADKVMFEPLGALLASGQEKDEAEEKDEKTPDAEWRLVVATTLAEIRALHYFAPPRGTGG